MLRKTELPGGVLPFFLFFPVVFECFFFFSLVFCCGVLSVFFFDLLIFFVLGSVRWLYFVFFKFFLFFLCWLASRIFDFFEIFLGVRSSSWFIWLARFARRCVYQSKDVLERPFSHGKSFRFGFMGPSASNGEGNPGGKGRLWWGSSWMGFFLLISKSLSTTVNMKFLRTLSKAKTYPGISQLRVKNFLRIFFGLLSCPFEKLTSDVHHSNLEF